MIHPPSPAELDEPMPERPRRRWRAPLIALLLAAVAAAVLVPLPMYVLSPGGALPVEDRVELEGATHPVRGDLLLTTVSLARATPASALMAWISGDSELVPRERLIPEDVNEAEYLRAQQQVFRESGQTAAAVGLKAAGLAVSVTGHGARVTAFLPESPAKAELRTGDVIVEAAGQPVRLASDLVAALAGAPADEPVRLRFRRGSEERQAQIRLRSVPGLDRPGLGVGIETVDLDIDLPFKVDIEQGGIGGPSAGLMLALTVYELAEPGDLARGRRIAGTGTIDLDGDVGPVGGVEEKVAAARNAGATLFLAPASEVATARAAADRKIDVLAVRTLDEAIAALRAGS